MAQQKSSLLDVFNYTTQAHPFMGGSSSNSLSLIKDAYSGKYYGNGDWNTVSSSLKSATDYFTSQANPVTDVWGRNTNQAYQSPVSIFGSTPRDTVGEAKAALSNIQGISNLTEANYVQRPQMLESYKAHTGGWDNYFEASYKNPRQTEANDSQAQMQSSGQSPLAIASPAQATPKTVGTGIASTSSINPFGRLDAGLGV